MEADFFARLTDRTMVTAKLYLEADELSSRSLDKIRNRYLEKLNSEVIRIYNSRNNATFIGDEGQYWSSETINRVRKEGRLQYNDGQRQTVGILYKDNQGDFVILVSAIDKSTLYRVEKLRNIMLITFVIIFIGLLLSGRWIARRILSPLNQFISEVQQITSRNLHLRVKEGNNRDEITILAQSFNQLMEHLEQAFVLQRTFVANASHELRTPVTSIMIGTEISLSKERQSEDYRKALAQVLEDASKMEAVINGLVNLAQADLEFGSYKLQPVRIDELLWDLSEERTRKLTGNPNGRLLIEMPELPDQQDELLVLANATLLMIAIGNMIANAFKFSDYQDVNCTLVVGQDKIYIEIKDQGIGIPEEIRPKIFKPFFSSSMNDKHKGSGMGLYMTYKIITLFGGDIQLDTRSKKGCTFYISLPKLSS